MLRRLLALWRGSPQEPDPEPPPYDRDTVDALVEEAKYHAAYEESRLSATNQRAAWLLAVAGVILTLGANQAREMLAHSASLGPVGRPIAAIALALGMAFIVLAIVFALGVIRQARSWEWDTKELKGLAAGSSVRRPKGEAQGTFLRGLQKRILRERDGFYRLHAGLNRAFAALAVGLVA